MSTLDTIVKDSDKNIVLRDCQRQAFEYLHDKKGNLLVSLPFGYGKSLIYHLLPQVLGKGKETSVCLTISPLNNIQKDQVNALKVHGISACRLNILSRVEDTTNDDFVAECDVDVERVKKVEFSIVLCHPEALFNTKTGHEQFALRVVAVVIDECHIIENWGGVFRTAIQKLRGLKSFFPNVPVIGLSGTFTVAQKETIPKQLGLENFHLIEQTPDRPNIFFNKMKKEQGTDVLNEYEQIVHKLCDDLYEKKADFPVTLLFLPIYYMSEAMIYLQNLFGSLNINESLYSEICSGQDEYVINSTIAELKKENTTIWLVLTTLIAGMGFDPKNVTHVIHACPPRNISQYLQEIGRAGRCGQPSFATLYYCNRDIGKNLPRIKENIINYCKTDSSCPRNHVLSAFGFEKDKSIIDCKCCSFCAENCVCESCVDVTSIQNMHV